MKKNHYSSPKPGVPSEKLVLIYTYLYGKQWKSCLDATYFSYISSLAFLASSSWTWSLSRRSSSWAQRTLSSMFWRLRYSLSFCSKVTVCSKLATYIHRKTESVLTFQGLLYCFLSYKGLTLTLQFFIQMLLKVPPSWQLYQKETNVPSTILPWAVSTITLYDKIQVTL